MNTSHAIDHPSGIQAVRLGNPAEGLLYISGTPTFRWYVNAIRDGVVRISPDPTSVGEVLVGSAFIGNPGEWVVRRPTKGPLSVWSDQQMTEYLAAWDAVEDEDNRELDAIVKGQKRYATYNGAGGFHLDVGDKRLLVWDDTEDRVLAQLRTPKGEQALYLAQAILKAGGVGDDYRVLSAQECERLSTDRAAIRQELVAELTGAQDYEEDDD